MGKRQASRDGHTVSVWCLSCDWTLNDLPRPLADLLPRCFSCHARELAVLPMHPDTAATPALAGR